MTHNPYKLTEGDEPLSDAGQLLVDQTEAAREPDRPRDAGLGALASAFKSARSPIASPDQNMIAGIAAAQAKAEELLDSCSPEVAELVQAEADRIAALVNELRGVEPDPAPEPEPEVPA